MTQLLAAASQEGNAARALSGFDTLGEGPNFSGFDTLSKGPNFSEEAIGTRTTGEKKHQRIAVLQSLSAAC